MLSLWSDRIDRAPFDELLAGLSIAFSLVAVLSFWVMQHVPFDPFSFLAAPQQLWFTAMTMLLLAAPFFCSGLAIALLLSRGAEEVGRLYAADLIGAGVGCAAIALVMPAFGGSGSIVVAAAGGFAAAAAFGSAKAKGLALTCVVLGLVAVGVATIADSVLPIHVVSTKRHPLLPMDQDPVYTAWNTFSRIDVYELPASPQKGRPSRSQAIIIDAGAAGTAMGDLSGGVREYLSTASDYRPSGIQYVGKEHPKVLIIGSGAGREVLEGLYFNASSITAIEINPIITNIITRGMPESWGGLFDQPEVRLVTEDGRSFVRRSKETYDVIISVQTLSDVALSSGALTMSESYVMTREALEDYYDHLSDDGVLMITRSPTQILKLFATIHEIFDRRDLGSPAEHLVAFRGFVSPYGHAKFNTGFLFKKSPFTESDVEEVRHRLNIDTTAVAGEDASELFYSSFDVPATPYEKELAELATTRDLRAVIAASNRLLTPATDDRPFFNQNLRFQDLRPYMLRSAFSSGSTDHLDVRPVTEIMLVTVLMLSVAIAGVLILLPLSRLSRQGTSTSGRWSFLTYFGGLGLGFIMIEIVLLQRLTLFLGQPIYTLAVVLASLLVFTGIGSYFAGLVDRPRRLLLGVLGIIPPTMLGVLFVMPWVLDKALGAPLMWRVVISIALVAPLGLLLGVPFPTGLRVVGKESPSLVPWAWGVNGFFTVIGSVSAMILGMALGFNSVLIMGAVCYLTAGIVIRLRPESPG